MKSLTLFSGYHRNLALLRSSLCQQSKESSARVTLYPFGVGDAAASCWLFAGTNNVGDGTMDCSKTSDQMRAELKGTSYEVQGSMEVVPLDWLIQV
jgi:hypothetical protein